MYVLLIKEHMLYQNISTQYNPDNGFNIGAGPQSFLFIKLI